MSSGSNLKLLYNKPDLATTEIAAIEQHEAVSNITSEIYRLKPHAILIVIYISVTALSLITTFFAITNILPDLFSELTSSFTLYSVLKIVISSLAIIMFAIVTLAASIGLFITMRDFFWEKPGHHYLRLLRSGKTVEGKVLKAKRLEKNDLLEITYKYIIDDKTKTGVYKTGIELDIRSGDQVKVLHTDFISILL